MRTFSIAAAQSSSVRGDIAQNVRRHSQLVACAAQHDCNVVVFPELSLTGYEPTIASQAAVEATDGVLQPLQVLADGSQVVILAGCPIRSDCEKPYIGMLVFQPDQAVSVYRKRFVHASEEPYFVAADDTFVFSACGMAIGVAICADISNPIHAADAARRGAYVYAAGVAKTPQEIDVAAANMAAHAKKHGMLAVLANYASATGGFPTGGSSAIWNEAGELVARAEPQGECLVLARKASQGWTGSVVKP
jgi:predicted amidohydrolase